MLYKYMTVVLLSLYCKDSSCTPSIEFQNMSVEAMVSLETPIFTFSRFRYLTMSPHVNQHYLKKAKNFRQFRPADINMLMSPLTCTEG